MSDLSVTEQNKFLHGPLRQTFIKTAAPIILVMLVNGTFAPVDAYFLGKFVGAEALTAVTLMFPFFMFLIALSTLVSSGYSSVLSRQLGANEKLAAGAAYAQSHCLSLLVCLTLILFFGIIGRPFVFWAADGSHMLADTGYAYISLMIFWSPLVFVLSLNIDTLRGEGRIQAMTVVTLTSAVLNIVLDYVFIAILDMGVEGSAYGTLAAQALALSAVITYRSIFGSSLKFGRPSWKPDFSLWGKVLALGAPSSLGYVGLAISSALTIYMLQIWATDYHATAGAFGISNRILTFVFLPLLGLSFATQTIIGNNYGARKYSRALAALRLAVSAAAIYGIVVQTGLYFGRYALGPIFVDDPEIIAELARILPLCTLSFFLFGPLMMISTHFQAIGDAPRAALLGLSRTYFFGLPLLALLPFLIGELGIWIFGSVAEVLVLILTILVLRRTAGLKSLLIARA